MVLLSELNISIIALISSSLGVVVAISSYIYKTNRDRIRDINKLFEKKADKELVKVQLENQQRSILEQHIRLMDHDEKNNVQFKAIDKELDSVSRSINEVREKVEETRVELADKIDKVQGIIINLHNVNNKQ